MSDQTQTAQDTSLLSLEKELMGKQASPKKGKGQKAMEENDEFGLQPKYLSTTNGEDVETFFREKATEQTQVVEDPFLLEQVCKRAAFYKLTHVYATKKVFDYVVGKNYKLTWFDAYGTKVLLEGANIEAIENSITKDLYWDNQGV